MWLYICADDIVKIICFQLAVGFLYIQLLTSFNSTLLLQSQLISILHFDMYVLALFFYFISVSYPQAPFDQRTNSTFPLYASLVVSTRQFCKNQNHRDFEVLFSATVVFDNRYLENKKNYIKNYWFNSNTHS